MLIDRYKQFLLCLTPTFLMEFRSNFHRNFVIKPLVHIHYCLCFAVQTSFAKLWPFVTDGNQVLLLCSISCFVFYWGKHDFKQIGDNIFSVINLDYSKTSIMRPPLGPTISGLNIELVLILSSDDGKKHVL